MNYDIDDYHGFLKEKLRPHVSDVVLDTYIKEYKSNQEEASASFWDEFKALFPKKDPNGTRRFHTNPAAAKKKYNNLVKNNRKLHEKILTLLKKEIEERTRDNSFKYMSNLHTYVNQKRWEAYEDDEGEETSGTHIKHNFL